MKKPNKTHAQIIKRKNQNGRKRAIKANKNKPKPYRVLKLEGKLIKNE